MNVSKPAAQDESGEDGKGNKKKTVGDTEMVIKKKIANVLNKGPFGKTAKANRKNCGVCKLETEHLCAFYILQSNKIIALILFNIMT